MINTTLFKYNFRAKSAVDIGRVRETNQDETIVCPNLGFFAVSDGMGGLRDGGQTSYMIKKTLPGMIEQCAAELAEKKADATVAAHLLLDSVHMLSNNIYEVTNHGKKIGYGATLSGVWLVDEYAVFINLGDSRGYLLPRYEREIRQITEDHNVAQLLVEEGELTKQQARTHYTSCQLTRFVGMPIPAAAEYYIEKVHPGDRIVLCSDGLYGEVEDGTIKNIIRSSKSPSFVCHRLIKEANKMGGKDNISAIYIKIEPVSNMKTA